MSSRVNTLESEAWISLRTIIVDVLRTNNPIKFQNQATNLWSLL